MSKQTQHAIALAFGVVVLLVPCMSLGERHNHKITEMLDKRKGDIHYAKPALLSADDGLSVIATALDRTVSQHAKHDCSHLVHAIYERAGFPYSYAPSAEIYDGLPEFQKVALPQVGDLVVWRGHVGIVVNPSKHIFFSFMRSGPGIDDYDGPYWKKRGHARFYRYIN